VVAIGILLGCASCGRIAFDPAELLGDATGQGDGSGSALADGGLGGDMVMISPTPIMFMMGCNGAIDSMCSADESPYHAVTLSPYEIDRTETTQASWAGCVTAGACTLPQTCSGSTYDPSATPNAPVTCIRYDQGIAYCAWRGARLPTEAEWELAARGTDGRVYPWGNQAPDCTFANMTLCPDQNVHDVGSHPAGVGPYGLQDMAGNAWEMVSDYYGNNYYSSSPTMDPTGPATGTMQTERGGGFFDNAVELRTSNRRSVNNVVNPDRGVRCAHSL